MKWSWVVALVVISSAAMLFGQEATPKPAASPSPVAQVAGRYQIAITSVSARASTEIWMIDTQTGDTWAYDNSYKSWTYQGNPTKDPGVRK